MTREEQIRIVSTDYSLNLEIPDGGIGFAQVEQAFQRGAEWADENTICPWISVEDDLPYRHKELLSDEFCTKYVFVLIDKHITNKLSMRNDKIMGWQWGQHFNVTHWMPIPKLDE